MWQFQKQLSCQLCLLKEHNETIIHLLIEISNQTNIDLNFAIPWIQSFLEKQKPVDLLDIDARLWAPSKKRLPFLCSPDDFSPCLLGSNESHRKNTIQLTPRQNLRHFILSIVFKVYDVAFYP